MAKVTFLMAKVTFLMVMVNFASTKPTTTDVPREGLSYSFYEKSCPTVEEMIKEELKEFFKADIGLAPALLRLHFHDCFVQGCDGSVLLAASATGPGEQSAAPNLTLRKEAVEVINKLRDVVHKKCGQIVSCADILTVAARDSIVISGGPEYPVPLGRRDSLNFATPDTTLKNLPSPLANVSQLISAFANKFLNTTDLVALSGAHTFGRAHCSSFGLRLYPKQDSSMNQDFAKKLKDTCPTSISNNTQILDIMSPRVFDNTYFSNLMMRKGLFTSDQEMFFDNRTTEIVRSFGNDQDMFFRHFAASMIKMGQIDVLTGRSGEVRSNCSTINSRSTIAD